MDTVTKAASHSPASVPAQRETHLPGEEGVWVLIFGDFIVFGAFFITYLVYRGLDPSVFRAGQLLLNPGYGLVNTIVLLTSSLFVAQAVQHYRKGAFAQTSRMLIAAILCAILFLGIKTVEYAEKINAGHTLNSSEFFIFYYMMTGIHALHVLIGIGVLSYLAIRCRQPAEAGEGLRALEGGAAFWHLVDLLWIVIYPLLYLVA